MNVMANHPVFVFFFIVHFLNKWTHISFLSTKTLYSLLPALLDTNPFSSEEKEKEKDGARGMEGEEKREGEGEVDDVSALPPKVAGLVEVYRCSLMLSREACLSPPLTSQTFGYLFFFTNTSLLNTLLERGETAQDKVHTVILKEQFTPKYIFLLLPVALFIYLDCLAVSYGVLELSVMEKDDSSYMKLLRTRSVDYLK